MQTISRKQGEAGQGMVEYGLIIGFLTIIVIAAMMMLAPQVEAMFSASVDAEMLGGARAGISSMIYAPAVVAAAASTAWPGGTYTPEIDFTPLSINFPPDGHSTSPTIVTLSQSDYDQTATATLTVNAFDIDANGEVVVVVNGVEYPLTATGNQQSGISTISVPKSALQAGANSISFKFDAIGYPAGYRIDALGMTLSS